MFKMKSMRGITLVALVITIIVMLILIGITVYMGSEGIRESKDKVLVSELGMMQHAVLQQYTKYLTTKNPEDLPGNKLNDDQINTLINEMDDVGVILLEKGNYYMLNDSALIKLGVENVKYTYIVNYETGEVINNTQKMTSKGEALYIKGVND